MMLKLKSGLEWLSHTDSKQHEWAMRYLKGKELQGNEIIIFRMAGLYDDLISWASLQPDTSDYRELISKMRGAWRQKKLRDHLDGKKAYNFVLAASVKKQLDELAKGQSLSVTEALERLISKKHNLQKKSKIQSEKVGDGEKLMTGSDFSHLAATTLGGLLGVALAELSRCTIQLNQMKIMGAESVEPQQHEIDELFKQKKAELFAKLSFVEKWDVMKFKRLIKLPKNS